MMHRSRKVLLQAFLFTLLALQVSAEAAVTACAPAAGVEALCSTASGTCTVSTTKNVAPGATVDCAGRDVVISGAGAKITVTGGAFTLKARNLTIEAGRSILVNEHGTIATGVRLELSQNLLVSGAILARNAGGTSSIDIVATESVTLAGASPTIGLEGTVDGADGGDLRIDAGGVIRVSRLVDASGKAAGTSVNQNTGGEIDLKSGVDVLIDAELRTFGRWYDGGRVALEAGRDVAISYVPGTGTPKGQIVADGREHDGDGGTVSITAGHQARIEGPITVAGGTNATGGEASGGTLDVVAGCGGITVTDSINATGGWSGGIVRLATEGDATISDEINLEARQGNGGGGRFGVDAKGATVLTTGAWITAWGHTASGHDGDGGSISIAGCTVDVQGGAILEAIGHWGGLIELRGRKAPADQTQFSVRVATNSIIDVGRMGIGECARDGRIVLDVRSPGPGHCENAPTQPCNGRADCPQEQECLDPPGNPNTGGVQTQFFPAPRKQLRPELLGCSSSCS